MSQVEIDYKELFKKCFHLLGLLNTDGLSVENKQTLDNLIQTYRKPYFNLHTETMLNKTPELLKSNPKFLAGMENWKTANQLQ